MQAPSPLPRVSEPGRSRRVCGQPDRVVAALAQHRNRQPGAAGSEDQVRNTSSRQPQGPGDLRLTGAQPDEAEHLVHRQPAAQAEAQDLVGDIV